MVTPTPEERRGMSLWFSQGEQCMKSLACVVSVLAFVAVVESIRSPAGAQEDKAPTIKAIMKKMHSGDTSLRPTIAKALKAEAPDWEEIQKATKEFSKFADSLAKNPPPRGEKESWEKLTKEFVANAHAMDESAKKKDKEGAKVAHSKLGNCKGCHDAHRKKG
jgi:cytochrome c556